MFYSANPCRDADRWIDMQEAMLEKLPKCDFCGEPITDDYYYKIGKDTLCEECMKDEYRMSVEAYINRMDMEQQNEW